jgi:membrane protein implicated in regulation of membrane protease activity
MIETALHWLEIFLVALYISTSVLLCLQILRIFTFGLAVLVFPVIFVFSWSWPVAIALWFICSSLTGFKGVVRVEKVPQEIEVDPLTQQEADEIIRSVKEHVKRQIEATGGNKGQQEDTKGRK